MTQEILNELNEKMEDLRLFCEKKQIPLIAIAVDPQTEQYQNVGVTPTSLGMTLKNDKISKFNLACNDEFTIKIKTKPEFYAGNLLTDIVEEEMNGF